MSTIEGWDSVPSQQPLQIFLQNAFWLIQLSVMYMKTSEGESFQVFYCSKWMIWHSIPKVIKIKVLVHNLFVHCGDKKESQSASMVWHTQAVWNAYLTSHNKQQDLQHTQRCHLFRPFWTKWRCRESRDFSEFQTLRCSKISQWELIACPACSTE